MTGGVAQWESTYLACMSLWVKSPALGNQQTNNNKKTR